MYPHHPKVLRVLCAVGLLVGTAWAPVGCDAAPTQQPAAEAGEPAGDSAGVVDVIAFGSCARSDRDQTIWNSIVAQEPDLFLFVGDNVYVDVPDDPTGRADYTAKYAQLAAKPGWQKLRATTPVLATWDDHDYGLNDAGAEFPLKRIAQEEFLAFFGVPEDSSRWDREGVYHAEAFGPPGRRVQVILLDTRYHRDPIVRNPAGRVDGKGPYMPHPERRGTVLGEAQWAWLEARLQEPADLRVVATSIQLVANDHGWEGWGNLPHERERMYRLIDETDAAGVVFVSGDRHLLEISRDRDPGVPYPIWDVTSSGFNWGTRHVDEPNRFRVGEVFRRPNFGVIRIDWSADDPRVTLEGRGHDGEILVEASTSLGALREK